MDRFLLIALFIAIIIFAPFIAVWCMNTLFFSSEVAMANAIPYTFQTWLASLLFFGVVVATKKSS